MNIQNWYLVRLYKNSSVLFLIVILFIFFQGYFNHKRIHSFPWFVWDMYSRVEYVPETLTQTDFFVNGKRLNLPTLSIWEEATVMHTFQKYQSMKNAGYVDPLRTVFENRTRFFPSAIREWMAYRILNKPEDMRQYPRWLHHYLSSITHQTISTLEIKEVSYRYENNQLKADSNAVSVFLIREKN